MKPAFDLDLLTTIKNTYANRNKKEGLSNNKKLELKNNLISLIISFIYIILITVLLVFSVTNKSSYYLILILVITIFYITYKIIYS